MSWNFSSVVWFGDVNSRFFCILNSWNHQDSDLQENEGLELFPLCCYKIWVNLRHFILDRRLVDRRGCVWPGREYVCVLVTWQTCAHCVTLSCECVVLNWHNWRWETKWCVTVESTVWPQNKYKKNTLLWSIFKVSDQKIQMLSNILRG